MSALMKRSPSNSFSGSATDFSASKMPYIVAFFALLWSSALVVDAVTTGMQASVPMTTVDTDLARPSMQAPFGGAAPGTAQGGHGQSFWVALLSMIATSLKTVLSEFLEGIIVIVVVVAVVCCLSPSRRSAEDKVAMVRAELKELDKAD